MLFQNGDKIVFIGDSVTDSNRAYPIGQGLRSGVGNGYVRKIDNILNVVYPDWKLWIVNTGRSGDNVRDLKERWQQDVIDLNPDWVSIMIGVNDVWRQYDMPAITESHLYLPEYKETLAELIEQTLPKVKGMIVLSPFFMEPQRDDMMRKTLDEYIKVCEETAKKYNCLYIDMQKAFDEYLIHRHSSYISWDRVHPGEVGSTLIAREFLRAIGMERSFI